MEKKLAELREMAKLANCKLIGNVNSDDLYLISYDENNNVDQQFRYHLNEKNCLDSIYRNLTEMLAPTVKELGPSFLVFAPLAFQLGYEIKIIDYYASLRILAKDEEEPEEIQRYPIIGGPDKLSDFLTFRMLSEKLMRVIPAKGENLPLEQAKEIVKLYDGMLPEEQQIFKDGSTETVRQYIDIAIELCTRDGKA